MPVNTKLKKISATVFQEVVLDSSLSRPLEWRSGLNRLFLTLQNIELVTLFNVHDKDWEDKGVSVSDIKEILKPDIKINSTIHGVVNTDMLINTIYCAEDGSAESDIFTLEQPTGRILVSIRPGKPTKKNEQFPNGVFRGSCLRYEDDIVFEMSIPEEQFSEISRSLNSKQYLQVDVDLLSFSSEIDDAVGEYFSPRNLFIQEHSQAYVASISLKSRVDDHITSQSDDSPVEDLSDDNDDPKEIPPEQIAHQELMRAIMQSILLLQKPVHSIVFALWALVIVLSASLFFKL